VAAIRLQRRAGGSLASRAFHSVSRFLLVDAFARLWNRLTLQGREYVPAEGAFVVAPVHRSDMDTVYFALVPCLRVRSMGNDSTCQS